MSGRMSRNKGKRGERLVRDKLIEYGIPAERIKIVPLSGMCEGFKGDLLIDDHRCEVKWRADGFRRLYNHVQTDGAWAVWWIIGIDGNMILMSLQNFVAWYCQPQELCYPSIAYSRYGKKYQQIEKWLAPVDFLFLKADRKPVIVILRRATFEGKEM